MGGMLVSVFVRSNDQAAVVRTCNEVLGSHYDNAPGASLTEQLQAMLPAGMEVKLGDTFAQMLEQMGIPGQVGQDAPLFLVSPSRNGWVGVHDSRMQNQDETLCASVVRDLSDQLHTTAICFLIHDGDFLCYWLAKDGVLLDEYNSMPGYFEEGPGESEPSGGDAELLAEACGLPGGHAELVALLSQPDPNAFGQLTSLGELLQIVDPCVDYNLLTYTPPKQIGFTVTQYQPQIADRDQYITITQKDLRP